MSKRIGRAEILPTHGLSCHCGAVVLEVDLPDGIADPYRCNCSICRRKGTIVAAVPLAAIRVVKGQEALSLYQFHTHTAKHFFCSHCGIHTHHQRRSNPQQYSFNLGCLDGVDPFEIQAIRLHPGANS